MYGLTDEIVLGRVVRNLVGNAIKFSASGGVLLGVVRVGERIKIRVSDTGMGIAQTHLSDIFQEYFQVPGTIRDRKAGVGFGLAIVRKSIDMLDGHRLHVVSHLDRGSTFSVSLPSAPDSGGAALGTNLVVAPERLRGAYVAVVDDEALVLEGITTLLRNWGCIVVPAQSVAGLIAGLGQNERIPDLLLTDWRLSDRHTALDALEALHREFECEVPVIIMTGDPVDKLRVIPVTWPVRWIQKPVSAADLSGLITAVLPLRVPT